MSSLFLTSLLAHTAQATQVHRDLAGPGSGLPLDRAAQALGAPAAASRVLTVGAAHTVRFEQTWQGLPVLGAQAAVRVLPDGSVPFALDGFARDLDLPTLVPALDLEAALALTGAASHPVHSGRLAILPEGGGRLVWDIRVVVPGSATAPLDALQVLVDARTGALLARRSLLRRALGRVYEQNPLTTPDTSDVELVELSSAEELTGFDGGLQSLSYESGSVYSNNLVGTTTPPSEGEDWLYDPPEDDTDDSDAFAQVMAYHHLSNARTWWEGITGESMASSEWDLAVLTNYKDPYMGGAGDAVDNAFYMDLTQLGASVNVAGATNLIAIGQGTELDFATDADVYVHESGHYVSGMLVGYNQGNFYSTAFGLSPWGGSVDEGISDYFAASMFDDPVIGEWVLASLGGYDRDISEQDLSCPQDIVGEVHEDGKLIGELGWALHEAYGADAANAMIWGAVTLMTADATFEDFAAGVSQVGQELLDDGQIDSLDALQAALAASGLDDCGLVQPVDEEPLVQLVWGLDTLAGGYGLDCATAAGYASLQGLFHFSLDSSEGDDGVRFDATVEGETAGDLSWQLYLRKGQPVTFASGWFLPEVDRYDIASDVFTEAEGSVEVTGDDFEPGSTWYGVLISQSCPNTRVTIEGEAFADEPVDTGTPNDGDDTGEPIGINPEKEDDDGRCGCATGNSGRAAGLLGLLGLLAVRRRKGPASLGR